MLILLSVAQTTDTMMHERTGPYIAHLSDSCRRTPESRGLDRPPAHNYCEALLRATLLGPQDFACTAVAELIDSCVEDDDVVAAVATADLIRHPVDRLDAVVAVARV